MFIAQTLRLAAEPTDVADQLDASVSGVAVCFDESLVEFGRQQGREQQFLVWQRAAIERHSGVLVRGRMFFFFSWSLFAIEREICVVRARARAQSTTIKHLVSRTFRRHLRFLFKKVQNGIDSLVRHRMSPQKAVHKSLTPLLGFG